MDRQRRTQERLLALAGMFMMPFGVKNPRDAIARNVIVNEDVMKIRLPVREGESYVLGIIKGEYMDPIGKST